MTEKRKDKFNNVIAAGILGLALIMGARLIAAALEPSRYEVVQGTNNHIFIIDRTDNKLYRYNTGTLEAPMEVPVGTGAAP